MEIKNVYLDESGHTGANLLDPEQPVFVYAAVALDDSEAQAIHSEAFSRFQLQGEELKGANLLKSRRGQGAASWILERTGNCVKAVAINKEYALAGKFFEYIIEPVISEQNSLFYQMDFHHFIAMNLYFEFKSGTIYGRDILADFQQMMRNADSELLGTILSADGYGMEQEYPLTQILTIALCHQARIEREIDSLKGHDTTFGWSLELSATSVSYLLASWSEKFETLRVFCDNSKPIAANLDLFRNFIGRSDKAYMWSRTRNSPSIVYNLSEQICLVDSKQFPAVQIADVWASALAYAYKHPTDSFSRKCLEVSDSNDIVVNTVFPDASHVDIKLPVPFLNWVILMKLCERSIAGEPLTSNIGDYYIEMARRFAFS